MCSPTPGDGVKDALQLAGQVQRRSTCLHNKDRHPHRRRDDSAQPLPLRQHQKGRCAWHVVQTTGGALALTRLGLANSIASAAEIAFTDLIRSAGLALAWVGKTVDYRHRCWAGTGRSGSWGATDCNGQDSTASNSSQHSSQNTDMQEPLAACSSSLVAAACRRVLQAGYGSCKALFYHQCLT